jgi:hypothetical protein
MAALEHVLMCQGPARRMGSADGHSVPLNHLLSLAGTEPGLGGSQPRTAAGTVNSPIQGLSVRTAGQFHGAGGCGK